MGGWSQACDGHGGSRTILEYLDQDTQQVFGNKICILEPKREASIGDINEKFVSTEIEIDTLEVGEIKNKRI